MLAQSLALLCLTVATALALCPCGNVNFVEKARTDSPNGGDKVFDIMKMKYQGKAGMREITNSVGVKILEHNDIEDEATFSFDEDEQCMYGQAISVVECPMGNPIRVSWSFAGWGKEDYVAGAICNCQQLDASGWDFCGKVLPEGFEQRFQQIVEAIDNPISERRGRMKWPEDTISFRNEESGIDSNGASSEESGTDGDSAIIDGSGDPGVDSDSDSSDESGVDSDSDSNDESGVDSDSASSEESGMGSSSASSEESGMDSDCSSSSSEESEMDSSSASSEESEMDSDSASNEGSGMDSDSASSEGSGMDSGSASNEGSGMDSGSGSGDGSRIGYRQQ